MALGYLSVFTVFFVVACSQSAKSQVQSAQNDKSKRIDVVYDTLSFKEEMSEILLKKNAALDKEKLKFYKKFINSGKINQLQKIRDRSSKTEIKYLGRLKDLKTKKSYHIITNFTIWGIGEMLSPRGRSEVVFIDDRQNSIMDYRLSMPGDLPIFIQKNVLFFQLEKKKLGISIMGGLPPQLCLPEIGCN
ncbi:hypothetical protein [Pedobacter caeni]|uniref:Uncharacterized protein n=1 Tax=Pedobacter caeni TaxID=288992 RepID=A0A1M4W6X5_9SPHI|nr:hypothetical protein [Pedobacter caeni]SHE76900.1 hypothetical protein SAMN04488522_1011155 [Pedobacter caeni]